MKNMVLTVAMVITEKNRMKLGSPVWKEGVSTI